MDAQGEEKNDECALKTKGEKTRENEDPFKAKMNESIENTRKAIAAG